MCRRYLRSHGFPAVRDACARALGAIENNLGKIATMFKYMKFLAIGGLLSLVSGMVSAAPIYCSEDANLNRMSIDDSLVGGCLDSGMGNINGNSDAFQLAFPGYELASKSDSANPFDITYNQNGSSGMWSIDESFWDVFSVAAIGFKFGTGNTPDNWFVFSLADGATGGNWNFWASESGRGGGLSHVNLYAMESKDVPEPAGIVLLMLGLCGLLVARRCT